MASTKNYLAIFGLLFGALCWGVIWYPYRIMQEAGVTGVASSFYTYLIASTIGALIFFKQFNGLHRLPRTIWMLALVAGWTNLTYVLAVIDGEVMRVMLLFYLSPVWTMFLAHFWLKERTDKRSVLMVAISLCGAFIMLWQPNALPLPNNASEWLALGSGMGFSLTNVITRRSHHLSLAAKSMSVWLGVMGLALIVMCMQAQPATLPNQFTLLNWVVMTFIALLLVAATLLVQYGVTHMPATRASVLFLFELVVAAIASYYLADEVMSPNDWIGGLLIIGAALYAANIEEHERV